CLCSTGLFSRAQSFAIWASRRPLKSGCFVEAGSDAGIGPILRSFLPTETIPMDLRGNIVVGDTHYVSFLEIGPVVWHRRLCSLDIFAARPFCAYRSAERRG